MHFGNKADYNRHGNTPTEKEKKSWLNNLYIEKERREHFETSFFSIIVDQGEGVKKEKEGKEEKKGKGAQIISRKDST